MQPTSAPQQPTLVTGGSGFVGSHIVNRFLEAGREVIIYDRTEPPDSIIDTSHELLRFVRGDILDGELLSQVVEEHDVSGIIHAAAVVGPNKARLATETTVEVNVMGTLNVLSALKSSGGRLTYLSTATLYGYHTAPVALSEDECADPVGIYDGTKFMGETLIDAYRKTFGIDAVSVRPAFVYGPGSAVGSYYLDRVVRGEIVEEAAGADHFCDFTYVEDLAHGVYLAHTTTPLKSWIFNISGGQLKTRAHLVELIKRLEPEAQISLGPGIAPGAHVRGPCDISRANEELGYAPRYDLESGLRAWHAWLKRENADAK